MKEIYSLFIRLLLLFCLLPQTIFSQNYHQYVNPFIGTAGHGHTYPGATLPFGMVQLSPDTRIDGSWDGCSGYHYSDNIIYGFSHTHLSGTAVSDYGDIMLMPTMEVDKIDAEEYSSFFRKSNETASAGFYEVYLDKHDINVELTASTRVGFHRYTFNRSGKANVILNLRHRDKLTNGKIRVIDNRTLEVYRASTAWAENQQVWARIEFNQPMEFGRVSISQNSYDLGIINPVIEDGLIISRDVKKGDKLKVKVSLSFTGFKGAELNASEIPHWNFSSVKKDAEDIWNEQLSKIEVSSSDENKLKIFYTALYHTMLQPNVASDLDGKYMGRDFKVHQTDGHDYYTVFSLWDTFRAVHPLYTLIERERTVDFIKTFLLQYEQGGRLPVWELASNETDTMIGYHAVSVMADAMVKGITGFDYRKAFEAALHSSDLDIFGLDAYKEKRMIGVEDETESVSKTLEYAYDDWCIAQMAAILKEERAYDYFMKRSQNWKNLFDPETRLMRPKKNGSWIKPFDPREVNHHFTEANAWQYSFFVPHNVEELIEFHGGKAKFEKKLDEMFSLPFKTTGRQQVNITGLIGQYAHGNEPSHHIAYLYNYVDKPHKTKQKVHYILDQFYKNTPDGLIGNEDCGQMSAWYVLSSIGIYPVAPASLKWQTVEPYFDKIQINLEDGSNRIITKKTPTTELEILGFEEVDPISFAEVEKIVPLPYFEFKSQSFVEEITVTIKSLNPNEKVFYAIDDDPFFDGYFLEYTQPIVIDKTSTIHAYSNRDNYKSRKVTATFYQRPFDYSIKLTKNPHPMFALGGAEILLDGIYADLDWRKGDWLGFQNDDFEAIIDLKEVKEINRLSANFLQDVRSWIIIPKKLKVYTSNNGKNYELFGENDSKLRATDEKVQSETIVVNGPRTEARYIKVVAENFGPLPDSHISAGESAYIFIDEINIK